VFTSQCNCESVVGLSVAWSVGGVYFVADNNGSLWRSDDGVHWSVLRLPFSPGSISTIPGAVVAIDDSAHLWGSADGRSWQGPAILSSSGFTSTFSNESGLLNADSRLVRLSDAAGTQLVAVGTGGQDSQGNSVSGVALLDVRPGFTGVSITPLDPAPPRPGALLGGVAVIGHTLVAATIDVDSGSLLRGVLWAVTLP
jgi:hypothetical protein